MSRAGAASIRAGRCHNFTLEFHQMQSFVISYRYTIFTCMRAILTNPTARNLSFLFDASVRARQIAQRRMMVVLLIGLLRGVWRALAPRASTGIRPPRALIAHPGRTNPIGVGPMVD